MAKRKGLSVLSFSGKALKAASRKKSSGGCKGCSKKGKRGRR